MALPYDGYTFVGWYDKINHRYMSRNTTYHFTATTNAQLQAVCVKTGSSTLTFATESGWISATVTRTTAEWAATDSLADLLPEVPYRYGYTATGWDCDERTVLEKLPAAAFYTAAVPESQLPTAQSYEKLLSTLSEQAIPAAYLFAGDTLPLGDAVVTVLSPARGTTWENLNNYSLVLRVTYGNTAFLLMGDAEAEVEETLLAAKTELAADVLVVGHHGSATSSSENFLKAVAPRYAILSVGEDNSYNLPNTGVLTRLKEQGTALYRTDLQGTVTVTSDGENLTITTAK